MTEGETRINGEIGQHEIANLRKEFYDGLKSFQHEASEDRKLMREEASKDRQVMQDTLEEIKQLRKDTDKNNRLIRKTMEKFSGAESNIANSDNLDQRL